LTLKIPPGNPLGQARKIPQNSFEMQQLIKSLAYHKRRLIYLDNHTKKFLIAKKLIKNHKQAHGKLINKLITFTVKLHL
jgi:hypothetical protein